MKLLHIFNLHLGPYKGVVVDGVFKETSVNAYIYYTKKINDKDEACNDKGQLIGTFMNDEARLALETMVKIKIVPVINEGLSDSPYFVSGTDFTNMAPHPHLVIQRRDGMPLNENEVEAIHELVKSAVGMKNLSSIYKSAITENNLFKQEMHEALTGEKSKKPIKKKSEPHAEEAPTHHYNLRKRR